MNIKVAAFTVSEKSICTIEHFCLIAPEKANYTDIENGFVAFVSMLRINMDLQLGLDARKPIFANQGYQVYFVPAK